MGGLPASIPRAGSEHELAADPLGYLARAHERHGNLVVLRDEAPLLSRMPDCRGVVAVFGPEHLRVVLGDLASFGLPISAARWLTLPPPLVNLNRGLHSMIGDEHAVQRGVVAGVLGGVVAAYGDHVAEAVGERTRGWRAGARIALLDDMRELACAAASRALFGTSEDHGPLVSLLRSFFRLRRDVSSQGPTADPGDLETLVALGLSLDEALRAYIRRCRRDGASAPTGAIAALATARTGAGALLDEDAVVAHANVLFISGTEPIAVALTWFALLASQRPELRRSIRAELAAGRSVLLEHAIDECLRIVPPNALMVRVTTRDVAVGGAMLPASCEVVVCPFVAHRDPARFPEPARFRPSRWQTVRPSPFEYLPFGAGGHSCIGKQLARQLIGRALAHLVAHCDLVLAHDQAIDWRVDIMLTPRPDPIMVARDLDAPDDRAGRLRGPVADLFGLDAAEA